MKNVDLFANKVNGVISMVVAILSYMFGEHWILFVGFLALNIGDWVTGTIAAYLAGVENSHKGWTGILKKFIYWIIIGLAFGMTAFFIEIGETIGVDLKITIMLGWFVLASLILNEIRSILENLVAIPNVKIPKILTKGLEVANKTIEAVSEIAVSEDDQNEEDEKV